MAEMQSRNMNGPQNGINSQHAHLNLRDSITRPFTLQEALPYSPQTSTVPFVPDIIPDPSLGSGSPAANVSKLFSRAEFDKLNSEAGSPNQGSKNMKQAVDYVLHDVKPSQRTQYNFRSIATRSRTAASSRKKSATALTPITQAVHERVETYFKPAKKNAAGAKAVNGQTPSHSRKSSKNVEASPVQNVTKTPAGRPGSGEAPKPSSIRVEVAHSQGFDPSAYVDGDSLAQPSPTETTGDTIIAGLPDQGRAPGGGFSVELRASGLKLDEYAAVATAPDAPSNLSTRRGDRRSLQDGQDLIGTSLDQRQRGEAALDALDSQMRTVFSAVGSVLGMEPGFDHIVTMTPDQDVAMTEETLQKMHTAIQKVIELRCFDRVPLEGLLQVMKLSEASLKQMDSIDIHIDEEWDENAADAWIMRLPEVGTAIKAARTCLRVLSGGREEKQLYSESVILKCVNLCKSVTEDIIMPLVELRSTGTGASIFKMLSKHKKVLSLFFVTSQKLFALMAHLITKIELSETAINTLEYTASKLIFVENAHFERESVVGVQKFDGIRAGAMDTLSQIFLIKPEQRQGIIDDILTSLEKLPVGKLSSRQFKLSEGGSIQPVSALIMRLVQSSSGRIDSSGENRRAALLQTIEGEEGNKESQEESMAGPKQNEAASSMTSEEHAAQQHAIAIQELDAASTPLMETAVRNASYVINFIVKRAIGSTKSGDTPYRNLLDLFVDDFTLCLDSSDWPSAELLLRLLMLRMVQLFEAQKTAAPAKNMALELLGSMSAAISRLRSQVKRTAATFEGVDADEMSRYLADLAIHILDQKSQPEHLVAWAGPYRATLEHLQHRVSEDPHLSSAISYVITDWGSRIHTGYDSLHDEDSERDAELGRLAYRLRRMISDRTWLASEYVFKAVTDAQAKLAFAIVLLRSPLCESFGRILNILLSSMASDQATVRSKSLKSVNQVLETDPSILDGDSSVIQLILECSSDSSTQVRDSALGLLGSCITMRPALEPSLTPKIIDRFQDAGVGVRKRAMKLARDIYLRNRSKSLRCAIANGLLRRVQDPDESVRELARQMIEEVWFAPFYSNDGTAAYQTSISEHVALIIQTVKSGTSAEILDKVFQNILSPDNKTTEGPFEVCEKLVSEMFGLLDNPAAEDSAAPSGHDALQVLTIFAKADPKLFNLEQIRLLKPQLASFSGAEELAAFRAVTVIYKRVLPQLPTVHSQFLSEVRLQLLKGIGKISSRGALDDLIACAKVVCELLNDFGPMANLVASGLAGIQKLGTGPLDPKRLNHLSAYAIIVGNVGKHCDLDQQIDIFKARFASWQGQSVPRLIVDVLSPFASPKQSLEARKAALEAIGLVCQSWPRNYVLAKVYTAFQQVFQDQVPILETMILRSFKEFLVGEERRSEMSSAAAPTKSGNKKELTIMGGTNFDDVASATTQRFLKDITRIALTSQDEHAFLAMEVLGSINRQGLTHPKETGITLITLETSANRKIAELAFMEHRSLHEKHETVLEREYVKAVQSAFNYQRDIVGDLHGATTDPFQPKLHLLMEVLKISKMKNRQRFFEKLCYQVDFDVNKLDARQGIPEHVAFARFIVENVAFFDYQTVGELQTAVHTIEKIFTTTGAPVAQAIESEIFNVSVAALGENEPDGQATTVEGEQAAPAPPPIGAGVDPARFRQLTAACVILMMTWEARTHLRRLYGMGTNRHDSKAKALAKDLNRAATKVQGVHGDRIWDELESHAKAFESPEAMGAKCKAFVELMNVDKEFKVVEEEDDTGMDAPGTPSEEDDDDDEGGERGRKRKGGSTPGGRKKRARSSSQQRKRGRPRLSMEPDGDELDGDWA